MSAWGRLMMSDIARSHLREHFLLGTGIGQFTWYYPQWQSQYFATHAVVPSNYFLSADESYIIFNEYLQLFETVGIFGFLSMLLAFILFIQSKSRVHSELLNSVKLTVVVILACGFTSYPFHVNFMLLLLGFCFITAGIVNENKNRLFFQKWVHTSRFIISRLLPIVAMLISGYVAVLSIMNYNAKTDWDNLRNRLTGSRDERKLEYCRIQTSLKNDAKLQVEYASFLLEDKKDIQKAIIVLESSQKQFISRVSTEALALAYKDIGKPKQAIDKYEWLCNFLPNKFEPKYQLLNLYKENNDTANILKIGEKILTMPVKISSNKIETIKNETLKMVESIKSSF